MVLGDDGIRTRIPSCLQNKALPIRSHPHIYTASLLINAGRRTESRTQMTRLSVEATTVVVFSYGGG